MAKPIHCSMRFSIFLFLFLSFGFRGTTQVFYKCESPGKDTVTWLLGTVHYIPSNMFQFDPVVDSALAQAHTLFSETYVDDGNPHYRDSLAILMQESRYPDNKKLEDFISKKEEKRLFKFYHDLFDVSRKDFKEASKYIPLAMHQRFIYRRGYIRMEDHYYQQAKAAGKRIVLLDDIVHLKEAYGIFKKFYTVSWLMNSYHNPYGNSQTEKIYLEQDTAKTKILLNLAQIAGMNTYGLMYRRNLRWFEVLNQNSSTSNFIYCGFAHLLGGIGLLNHYRKKGYTITAVPVNNQKNQ